MRLVVGGDHAGFPLKGPVVDTLRPWGHEVIDVGTDSPDLVEFPDIAELVCDPVRKGEAERGIMVCGTGVGASIAPTSFAGSARCSATTSTRLTRASSMTLSMRCVHWSADRRR